ncbi:aldehyde dehydrogenase family protein [Halogeometricum pallidum]|uniref:aldehyde dehydrogenase family protein n=1 Tax=Halogeometricum pallidum TaxID=411361 RepID=UPI000678101C|nr:aldehyde dehydrogenase family protein [Halogeometricum pallidum]
MQTDLPAIADEYGVLIDGTERAASSGETLTVHDPATGDSLTTVAAGTEADVNEAVDVAWDGFETWYGYTPARRCEILNDVARAIRDEKDRLARIETLENGKPLSEAVGQVERCARHFEYYGGLADKIEGESIPLDDGHVDYTIREPLGVTGHIVPWNVPAYLFARSVAPALAAGNAAVVKPAEETPVGALELTKLLHENGVPPAAVNVVPGEGVPAGSALSGHPDIGSVTFTGSSATGREVGKAAIGNLTEPHLELGGKSPLVIYDDADLDVAVDETIKGIFATNSGQVCSASSRVIVQSEVHDAYLDKLVSAVEALSIGPGIDDHDVGPLVSATHLDTVAEYLEVGREELGEPLTGGAVLDREGYYVEPTVFADVPQDARILQEEVFGPVLTVSTFDDEAEAIQRSNDVDYGLVAGVITTDMGRAHRFARDVDAGQIYVNEWFAGGNETPFGGYKDSGIGRENGTQAIHNYTQLKNVCLNISE